MHLDINECETLNGGCDHQCKNANGSYICECNKGFFLDGNGKTCSGISKIESKVFYSELMYMRLIYWFFSLKFILLIINNVC